MTSFGRTTPSEFPNLRTFSSTTADLRRVITIVITLRPFWQQGLRQIEAPSDSKRHNYRVCNLRLFGTRSVQLSQRKRGTLPPKRHQIKHLVCTSIVRDPGVGGSNPLSPTNLSLAL